MSDTSNESLSKTIGRIPKPSLPVDSAINCSTQSPKPTISVPSGTNPSLSLKFVPPAVLAMAAPSIRPGLESRSWHKRSDTAIASFSKAVTSTPARAVGTIPKAVRAE